jgi:hypothetical protein
MTIRFQVAVFLLLAFHILGSVSSSYSQHYIVQAPFIVGTSNFADSIALSKELKEIGEFCLQAYDLNTVDVGIGAFRCSDDEPEYLWNVRMTKFVRLLYELLPKFKTIPMNIYFDPLDRPFRELYLTEDSEIGASFYMVDKKYKKN